MKAYAAVDLGASSGRVMLGVLGADSLALREIYRFTNAPVTVGGRLLWDVQRLFAETLSGLRRIVEIVRREDLELCGIGVDSWGVDYGLVTTDGVLRPHVGHHRGVDTSDAILANRGVTPSDAYARTGVLDQSINTAFQLMADIRAGRHERGDSILLIPDLWVYLLTSTIGAELTIASTTQLLDRGTDDWSAELIERHGLSGLHFPALQRPGTLAGVTSSAVTDKIGASAPIPVYRVAGHDTASALAIAEPAASGEVTTGLVSSGSWSLVGLALDAPVLTEDARLAGFTNELGAYGQSLFVHNLNGMWILQECLRVWGEEDDGAINLESLLRDARQGRSAERVFDVGDKRLLAPGDMPARIVAMCAEVQRPEPRSRADVVRALLESLASAYATALDSAQRITGRSIHSVRIVGGGSRNRLLCQLTADRTRLRVIAGPREASSLGNVAVQIVGSGARATLADVYAIFEADAGGYAIYLPSPPTHQQPIGIATSPEDHQ